ncbi:MAG: L-seryl-tRNA(Sec) selenium transferase, partial [Actinobacteria bacterium]|nr:L-seryl-tRNA(Sec) selenium transferase [Actinomycetota bacterium]
MGASADALRRIPSVERIAQAVRTQGVAVPDRLITSAVRVELALVRARLQAGGDAPDLAAIAGAAAARALALLQDAPRPVVNATGVIVHTN